MRFIAALLGALLILVTASPADAAPSESRAVRLALTPGVDITVPAAVNLGTGFTGGNLTGALGVVEVRDSRGPVNPNTWIATVSAGVFVTGAGGAQRSIAPGRISYWSGPATRSTGGGVLVPGQPTSAQAVPLDGAREAFRKTSGNGNNEVRWSPTVRIAIPAGIVAGTYRGTITHSVA